MLFWNLLTTLASSSSSSSPARPDRTIGIMFWSKWEWRLSSQSNESRNLNRGG